MLGSNLVRIGHVNFMLFLSRRFWWNMDLTVMSFIICQLCHTSVILSSLVLAMFFSLNR